MDIRISNTKSILNIYNASKLNSTSRMSRAEESIDSLYISSRAKDFSVAKKAISDTPDIRADKVSEFKNKLSTGYDISPKDIADKMVDNYFNT